MNTEIQITQFPMGENLSLSKGKILKINKYRFSYNASTLSGSSGSPIVLFGKEKVIGIHKGGNENKEKNYGDFIGPINDIINQLKKNGEGIEYYENGNKKYEGNFLDDEYEGDGKFYYENGDIYIGKFEKGKKEGDGIILDSDGNIKEQGTYKDDELINDNNKENIEYENNDNSKSDSENEIKEEEEEEEEIKRKKKGKKEKRKKVDFENNNNDSDSSLENKDIKNKNEDKSDSGKNNNINNLTDLIPSNIKIGFCDAFYNVFNALGVNCTGCCHPTKNHKILGNGRYLCNECNEICAIRQN